MSEEKFIYFSPNYIYSKRDHKMIVTSLDTIDQKIYSFDGPCAELLDKLTIVQFVESDYLKFSKQLSEKFSFSDWQKFLTFCLNEKIFIQN